jgi:hypothetical protein
MNFKPLMILTGGIAVVAMGTIAHTQFFKPSTPVASERHLQDSTRQATITALANQLAQVEVRQAMEGEKFTEHSPVMMQLKEQQTQLEQRLAQVQPTGDRAMVNGAIANAINAEIAALEVQHAKAKTQWNDSHPMLQQQAAQLAALRQRLTTL